MEITDDKILKVALITTLIGILGLIFTTPLIEVKEVTIDEIDRGMIDEEVSITGIVDEVKPSSSGSTYFLKINDGTGSISLIIFESALTELEESSINLNDLKGKNVKVTGKITEYDSSMEIILSNGNSLKII